MAEMLQSTATLLVLFFVTVSARPFSTEWSTFSEYVDGYNKPYKNDSRLTISKFEAFQQSLVRHEQLKLIESQRKGTAVYGINKFSDLTPEEFKSVYLSSPRSPSLSKNRQALPSIISKTNTVPLKFDWRDRNGTSYVTSVNNQQYCGSCWAFSVVETLESAMSIESKVIPQKLSAQQLISCETDSDKLDGCKGGEIIYAMDKITNKTIIVEDKVYPFSSSNGETGKCWSNLPSVGVQLQDFHRMYSVNEEKDMTMLVSQISPTSNAVNAAMWQDYKEGIIQHHCTESVLDHAIQVVGYSLENDPIPYWIVRNTWGKDWGEDGYLRLSLGSNTCGIAYEVAAISQVKVYT